MTRQLHISLTISIQEDESYGHEERVPVELVLRIALPGEAPEEVAGPGADQDDGHEPGHLRQV